VSTGFGSDARRAAIQSIRAAARRRSTKASSAATGTRRSLPSLTVSSSPELMRSYTNVRPHPSRSATSRTVSSSARARIGRRCEARTDVTDGRRASALSRTGGSSKNNSDCAMCALYIPSAYRSLTLFAITGAITGVRSGAPAYSIQCAPYRDRATVAECRRCSSWSRWRRDDDLVKLPVVDQGPVHCAACNVAIDRRSVLGRPPRFCGPACRAAAYRRRRQRQPESLPRWPHHRGQLRLSGADFWETRRDALAGVRATAREERARQAAVRRALRRWDSAFAAAERIHVLRGAPAPTPAAAAAWREIAAAAAECARVQAPGGPWTPVRESAERSVSLLTPPHLTRADHRRREREERKLARRRGLAPGSGVAL
jgi:hypothetical protein